MPYQKTNWKDHVVEYPNRVQITENVDGTKTVKKEEGTIIQKGTPVSATNLNKLEQGVEESHQNLAAHLAEKVHQGELHGIRATSGVLEYFDGIGWNGISGSNISVTEVSSFQASPDDSALNLSWINPSDVIVQDIEGNNITLAKFAGVKIIRKEGNVAPVGINDGIEVYDGTAQSFIDATVTNYQEYSYSIFPYTDSDNYSNPSSLSATPVPYTMDYTVGVSNFSVVGATELGSQAELSWSNPTDANFAGVLVRRGDTAFPTAIDEGVEIYNGTGTSHVDTGLTNGQIYYYTIWAYSTNNEYSDDTNKKTGSAEVMQGQDGSGSPGSAVLVAGDTNAGYFGTVPSSDLIDGNTLASNIGLSAGTSQNSTVDWLKFMIDGKVIFTPMKSFRHSISWDQINSANAVFGSKTVTIDGLEYKVRLWRGAENDPSNYTDADRDAIGSEWNRLMLPIHVNAPSSWAYPDYGGTTEDWGTDFTDADLLTHYNHGDGAYSWCQETRGDNTASRVIRGYDGVSLSASDTSSNTSLNYGWRPLLELL